MNLEETKKAIQLIIPHTDCIAWTDFSDKGNSCTGRLDILTDSNDIAQNALSFSNVKQAMPKQSDLHFKLSPKVASEIGANWVTYDWLSKVLGRILEEDYTTFINMFNFSTFVRRKMKEKGLAEISSLEDLFRS